MALNKFQKDVQGYLFDKLDSEFYDYPTKIADVDELVDLVFEEDKISNMPLAGNSIQEVVAYVDENRLDIANSLNEYKQRGDMPVMSAEELLANPNGFLIEASISEAKNMLAKSPLAQKTDFVLDKPTMREFLNVIDNIDVHMEQKVEKDNNEKINKDVSIINNLDLKKVYNKRFEDLNELVNTFEVDYKKRVAIKDVLKDTHIARMKHFKADDTFIKDLHELTNPKALKQDREVMSVDGENKFLNAVYAVYQQESFSLPAVLQDKSLAEFKKDIYDNSSYTERRNGKFTEKAGNAVLKNILPVTMYRDYEKYKGIPLDVNAKILRHSSGTTYECELGKLLQMTDTMYHEEDKKKVHTLVSWAVTSFKGMNKDVKDYLQSVAKGVDKDLTPAGRELLNDVAIKCFSKYRSRTLEREPAKTVNRGDNFGR